MRRFLPGWGLALAALWMLACSGAPPWFELVSLEQARELLGDPAIALVDVVADGTGQPGALPGGVRWKLGKARPMPPEEVPPDIGVLVVGSERSLGLRSAAALARAGNRPVYVFIPGDADERSSLYALALETKEESIGQDS